jgi:membrane-bound serine protease (ClpP class)
VRFPLHFLRLTAALVLVACAAATLAASAGASAASERRPGRRGILVVQVEGAIDPPNSELVLDAIDRANDDRLTMVVLQLDSKGAVGTSVVDLMRAIGRSRVPIVVWVGPSGAEARSGATLLLEAAHVAVASPGSDVGPADPVRLDEPDDSSVDAVRAELARLAEARGRDPQGAAKLAVRSLSAEHAARVGATNAVRPTLGETIVALDGKHVTTAAGDVRLSTAKVIGEGRDRRRQPNQEVVFDSLGIGGQARHALLGSSTAYFLLIAGLALIVFEFFAASVGFAAAVGAVAVVGAAYGFASLPVHLWALALLVLAAFGFSIDAQAGGLGAWTVIATVSLLVGSFFLYGGSSELHPPWWLVGVVCLGAWVFYVFAIPPFIRARFSTPTLGREGMIGELGTADVAVDPDGVVTVRGARWRARTNRATPLARGATVRVVAVEGVVLEVEPEEGGAKDYRDRGRRASKAPESGDDSPTPEAPAPELGS